VPKTAVFQGFLPFLSCFKNVDFLRLIVMLLGPAKFADYGPLVAI
jgi:hypothetical protein